MLDEQIIVDLVDGLQVIFEKSIQQIILYGSVARQENTLESDIDIAIILNKKLDKETKEKFIEWSAEMDLKYEKVFSIIDIEKEKMEEWGNVLPFYKNICEEGVVLWEACINVNM